MVLVDEPFLWICIRSPGRRQIEWAHVRFNRAMTHPLPNYLEPGTTWCYAAELQDLDADQEYAMTCTRVVHKTVATEEILH